MRRNIALICLLTCLPLVGGCTQEASEGTAEVDVFLEALKRADHQKAYRSMCPEFQRAHGLQAFTVALSGFAYLQGIKEYDCGGWGLDGAIMKRPCSITTNLGELSATLYARAAEGGSCIVAMAMAGGPVVSLGFLPAAAAVKVTPSEAP